MVADIKNEIFSVEIDVNLIPCVYNV